MLNNFFVVVLPHLWLNL